MEFNELQICLYLGKMEMEYIPKYLGSFKGEIVKPLDEEDDEHQNFENGEKCIVFKASDFYRWFDAHIETVNDILVRNTQKICR